MGEMAFFGRVRHVQFSHHSVIWSQRHHSVTRLDSHRQRLHCKLRTSRPSPVSVAFSHAVANLFKARLVSCTYSSSAPQVKLQTLVPFSPRLVCANVGRIAILGHLSAPCPFRWHAYPTFFVGYAGPAVRTYMPVTLLYISIKNTIT